MKEDNIYYADLYRKNPAFQQRLDDGTFDQLLCDIEKQSMTLDENVGFCKEIKNEVNKIAPIVSVVEEVVWN